MKKSILSALFAVLMGAMLTLVGCQEPDVEAPAFPEKVSAVVAAGETYEFTINPNMAWSMRIPTESATFFKFIVGQSEQYTLNGVAGTHTITVGVSNIEEFDVVRVCHIEMTMGGETKVVATITRGGLERTLKMYVAEWDAESEMFAQNDNEESDEQYIYGTTPVEKIDWVWHESNGKWMQRVVVEANFDWYLSPETPAWLNITVRNSDMDWVDINKIKSTAGRKELFLQIDEQALPLEKTSCNIELGTLSIDNSTDAGFKAVASYPTEMEGCKDVCEVSLPSSLTFNFEGKYYQASSDSYTDYAMGTIRSPRGAELVVLYKDASGNYSSTGASWMRLTVGEFPEEAGSVGVWSRELTLKVAQNKIAESREGAIAAIPQPVAKSGGYNAEDYIVSTIFQEPYEEKIDLGPIYPNDEGIMAATNSKFTQLENGVWPYTGSWGKIPNAYKLIYQGNSSGDDLIFDKAFTRYEIFGFNESSQYDLETCWLTIEKSAEHKGLENGYFIRSRLGEYVDDSETDKYTNPLAGDGGENEAFIFFYDENDEAFAFIYFILDPNYSTPIVRPEGSVIFSTNKDDEALGAQLKEIVKGDEEYSPELATYGTLQYKLTLNPNCTSATLLVPNFTMAYAYAGWATTSQNAAGMVTIAIDTALLPETDATTIEVRTNVSLYSGSGSTEAVHLILVYKFQ